MPLILDTTKPFNPKVLKRIDNEWDFTCYNDKRNPAVKYNVYSITLYPSDWEEVYIIVEKWADNKFICALHKQLDGGGERQGGEIYGEIENTLRLIEFVTETK